MRERKDKREGIKVHLHKGGTEEKARGSERREEIANGSGREEKRLIKGVSIHEQLSKKLQVNNIGKHGRKNMTA